MARLGASGALHHIVVRGTMRSAIFKDDQDKVRFLDRLSHLFENRYKSIHCDEEAYLLVLVRSIRLNPV